jgi:hypothetical protein
MAISRRTDLQSFNARLANCLSSVPSFQTMISSHLSVDDYLMEIDSEFPQFDRFMSGMLKEFPGNLFK